MSLDFTPSNTAPVAKSAATAAPDNTAPDAITRAALAPVDAAAAVISRAALTPDDTVPTALGTTDFTPTAGAAAAITAPTAAPENTAPASIGAAHLVPDDAAPVALATPDFTPTAAAAAAITAPTATPDDTAPTAKTAVTAAPDNTAPETLSVTPAATNEPPAPMDGGPLPPVTDATMHNLILNLPSMFALNAIYGQVRVTTNQSATRAQIQLAEAPQGQAAQVTVVDGNGDPVGIVIPIPVGEKFAEVILGAPLALLAGANLRAKATAIGSDAQYPGGFGVLTIETQLPA